MISAVSTIIRKLVAGPLNCINLDEQIDAEISDAWEGLLQPTANSGLIISWAVLHRRTFYSPNLVTNEEVG